MNRISSKTAARILGYDALFTMGFCLWWVYTTGNHGIFFIGLTSGTALLDLSARAEGKSLFHPIVVITAWSFMIIIALSVVLASLGLVNDAFGLLNK